MGLWTTKDGPVRLTPAGVALIDLSHISEFNAKQHVIDIKLRIVVGYDVLLSHLRQSGRTFDELDTHLKQSIGVDWKSKNQTMFRVNWLRSLGYVAKEGRQYELTEAGRELANRLAAPDHVLPNTSIRPPDGEQDATEEQTELSRRAKEIGERIETAAVEGGDGTEFERATAEAFRLFGFTTQVIGGSGNPDIVASAQMGDASYGVLVETKSRSGGVVHQNDVSFQALREHKVKASADYTVVVGRDFTGGNLEKWAVEHDVRLMRTEVLRQLLLAHAEAVLPLDGLRDLFKGGGSVDEAALSQVLTEADNTTEAMSLARKVYEAVRMHQNQEGVLNSHSLFFILDGEHLIQSIEMTINLLQSELISAIGQTDGGSLYTRLAPSALNDRLAQLSQVMSMELPHNQD